MKDAVTTETVDSLRAAIQVAWKKEAARDNYKDGLQRIINMRRMRVLDRCSQAAIDLGYDWWAWRKTAKLVMGWQ
jgi:hypothetical protein